MEAAVFLLIVAMFLFMWLGYFIFSGVLTRYHSGRLSLENRKAVTLAERYMAQAALAKTRLARDHRRLKVLTRELDLSGQELARLNDMKSKFLSMAVHDIRSPLAVIKGFSTILSAKISGDKEKEQFSNIVNATDQLNRLIADLTDLAMIEAGKLVMEPAPFDLGLIAVDIVPGIRLRAAEKGVEFVFNEPPAPVMVNGDRFRLAQVLMNLMNNALKFTPAGGAMELRVALEGAKAAVYVRDSGIGIHPSETRKIFEKFYQARYQKDANLRKQGWGLGLAISTEIITGHRGEIGATSPGLGKGATFYYKIPALSGF